jgi:hypothetical protein
MSSPSGFPPQRIVGCVAAVLVALSLTLAACGGGADTSTITLTKARYLKEGNAICAQTRAEILKVYGRYTKKPRPDALLNRLSQELVIPATKKEVRRLRALGSPAGEGSRVAQILAAIEEGIENGERDRRTLRSTGGTQYAFTKALHLEVAYGLEKCALG